MTKNGQLLVGSKDDDVTFDSDNDKDIGDVDVDGLRFRNQPHWLYSLYIFKKVM
jgi:hypothetical protein